MGWARFEDRRAMNRKLREAGFAATGLDSAAICQVTADMTDGHISRSTVEMLAAAYGERRWQRLVDVLVKVGRWEVNGSGWYIHDYLEFNSSRAERQALVAERTSSGRAGGIAKALARARAKPVAKPLANDVADDEAKPVANDVAKPLAKPLAVPSPSRPVGRDSRFLSTNDPAEQPAEKPESLATQQTGDDRLTALAYRIVDTCRGYENPRLVRAEAAAVVAWAVAKLDTNVIDQAIGEAAQWPRPPVLPRAIAAHILLKANDCRIPLEAFEPARKRAL